MVPPKRSYFFTLVADPQIGWNRNGYNSEELFHIASTKIKQLQPEFIIVVGDLIQTPSNVEQYTITKSLFDSIEIPYLSISGNHDVNNIPTVEKLNEFVHWWSIPYYWYTYQHYQTLFIMLESNILRVRDDDSTTTDIRNLANEQLDWLKDTLQTATNSTEYDSIFIVLHHPLAVRTINEDVRNENLPPIIRQELITIMEQYSTKIVGIVAGHYHKNAYLETPNLHIPIITYASTGVIMDNSIPKDPSGFAIVKMEYNPQQPRTAPIMDQQYYGYNELPTIVESTQFDPGFQLTVQPQVIDIMTMDETTMINLTWASSSMARNVKLEYQVLLTSSMVDDNNNGWQTITSSTPNNGWFFWTNVSTTSTLWDVGGINDAIQFRISSHLDPTIYNETIVMLRTTTTIPTTSPTSIVTNEPTTNDLSSSLPSPTTSSNTTTTTTTIQPSSSPGSSPSMSQVDTSVDVSSITAYPTSNTVDSIGPPPSLAPSNQQLRPTTISSSSSSSSMHRPCSTVYEIIVLYAAIIGIWRSIL